MAGYALVKDNTVVNIIEWDGVASYPLAAGESIYPSDAVPAGIVVPASGSPLGTIIEGTVFLARVTDAEYQAVTAAAASNAQLARWIEDVRLTNIVDIASDAAQQAKAALVAAGLLTAPRADIVFATS